MGVVEEGDGSLWRAVGGVVSWSAGRNGRTNVGMVETAEVGTDRVLLLQIFYASMLPYTLSLYLVKAALLVWYYTITPKTLTRCRSALQAISGLCVLGFFLAVGFNFLWCWPVSRNWTLDGPRMCVAAAQLPPLIVTLVFHLITNILIFVYPFPLMRSAHLVQQSRRTWGIAFLFALGFVAIASTVARVAATMTRYARIRRGLRLASSPCMLTVPSTTPSVVAVWTTGECTAGIAIVCCPALRLLIQSSTPRARLHHKGGSPSPVHHHHRHRHHGSTDTYASTTHTARTTLATSEIWDGTDSTAPEWIRLGSRGIVHADKDIEMGSYNSSGGGDGDTMSAHTGGHGGRYAYTPPSATAPGFVLQPGRGIIQHAPGVVPFSGGVPCWMALPDPPFLSEKDEDEGDDDDGCVRGQTLKPPPPSKPKVRWGVDGGGDKEWDDGGVLENRDRWEPPRASDRLDRIVETLSEPATATKRWSQGSFGDRNGHHQRKDDDEEERAVISKETFFFD